MNPSRHQGRRPDADIPARDEEIVSAAFALFSSLGYHSVSLAAIATAARVAVRTIYSSFGGKIGLVNALITQEAARHSDQLASLNLPEAPKDRLNVLAEHLSARAADTAFRNLQVIVISSGDDALARDCDAAGPGQFKALARQELCHAQQRGLLHLESSIEELVDLFVAIIVGPQLSRFVMPALPTSVVNRRETKRRLNIFLQAAGCTSPS